jgi:hypothetical protein
MNWTLPAKMYPLRINRLPGYFTYTSEALPNFDSGASSTVRYQGKRDHGSQLRRACLGGFRLRVEWSIRQRLRRAFEPGKAGRQLQFAIRFATKYSPFRSYRRDARAGYSISGQVTCKTEPAANTEHAQRRGRPNSRSMCLCQFKFEGLRVIRSELRVPYQRARELGSPAGCPIRRGSCIIL